MGRVLQAAREACGPEMALLVKADCNGCGDLRRLLELYQEAGVDGVELSGVDFAARAGEKSPFYLQEALRAMEGIQVPLSLVGGIFDLETAEAVLEQGFSFVSFSRALICQPDFIARMKRGAQGQERLPGLQRGAIRSTAAARCAASSTRPPSLSWRRCSGVPCDRGRAVRRSRIASGRRQTGPKIMLAKFPVFRYNVKAILKKGGLPV